GTQSISGIMRWDGSQWADVAGGLSGNIPNNAPVLFPHNMEVWNDQLIVGGNFRFAGGVEVNGIASWDGTNWSAMGSGFNGTVYDIQDYFGTLYVGGSFTSSGSTDLGRIASWNGTDWEYPGFGFEPVGQNDFTFVHTLKLIGERLYIAGGLKQLVFPGPPGGDPLSLPMGGITAFDQSGTFYTFNGGVPNNDIEAIALLGNELLVGGGVFGNGYSGILDLSVGTVNPNLEEVMTVQPNPANEYVQVQFSRQIPNGELQVFDLTGRIVSNTPITGLQVELQVAHLPKGQYFIRIKGESGVQIGQFIKQ
ncbi:MAG: T9SS type A sorting domain-containing protein, partial [Bacteroidota bacterium]